MIMKMRNMMNRRPNQKGFTLVELIVVMAILAILAAIAVPKYNQVTANANNQATSSNVRTIVSAVQLYQAAHNGALPTSSASVEEFLQSPIASLGPSGATYTYSSASGTITIVGNSPTSGVSYTSTVTAGTI